MKKIKDLTLNELLEIAKKYNGRCINEYSFEMCPLYQFDNIPCHYYCDLPNSKKLIIMEELEKEIEVINND